MNKELETLLSAINMADMEGVKELEVGIEDLQLLRKTIIDNATLIAKLETALTFKIKCAIKSKKMLKDYKSE